MDMLNFIIQGTLRAVLPMNLVVMFIGLLVGIVGACCPALPRLQQ